MFSRYLFGKEFKVLLSGLCFGDLQFVQLLAMRKLVQWSHYCCISIIIMYVRQRLTLVTSVQSI